MARSDFDMDDNNDYENQPNKRRFFGNSSNNNFNGPEIVYDESTERGPLGQITYYLSTINKSVIVFFGIILAAIIVGIFVIIAIVSSYNKSFKTDINIPEVVYLGETAAISAISNGTGNVSKTNVVFENVSIKDEDANKEDPTPELAVELANKKMVGKEVYNTMIPIEEGSVKITVKASSGTHRMGKETKQVYVCPKFNSSLVYNGIISVKQGDEVSKPIDFGPGLCSSNIKYKSDNTEIFTVNNEGNITGVKTGVANLIVTRKDKSFSIPVHVTSNYVTMNSFNITPKKIQLNPGENRRLNVSYLPTNASTQKLNYSSGNSEIVKVDNYGKIEALKNGTTEIKVTTADVDIPEVIEVVVSKTKSKSGSTVTDLTLENQQIDMVQGESYKLNYLVTPDDAMDKTVTFNSTDESVATVNKRGVVFAKKGGNVSITASTNNAITKIIEFRIKNLSEPTVLADDGIIQNNWHNKDYKLKFTGGGHSATYYYGFDKNHITKKATEVHLKKDGIEKIYSKACIYNLCGPTAITQSKLDSQKPKIIKIVTREDKIVGDKIIYVAAEDNNSEISKWCITNKDNSRDCNWIAVSSIKNPVLSKRINSQGQFFVFVKDEAGNISKSESFTINNVDVNSNNEPLDY